MAEVLPAGDKIKEYDSRVDPDAPPQVAQVIVVYGLLASRWDAVRIGHLWLSLGLLVCVGRVHSYSI